MMQEYLTAIRHFSRDVWLFLAASAAHGFVFFGIYALLLNLYLLRLGYGPQFVGMVNAVGPFALALASLPAGVFSRRYGIRLALLLGYGLTGIGLLLIPLGEFLPESIRDGWILGSYAFSWFFVALAVVNFGPFIMAATSPAERNYAFSLQMTVFPVFGFVGNLVGGILPGLLAVALGMSVVEPGPFRVALILATLFDLIAVAAIALTKEPQVEPVAAVQHESGNRSATALPVLLILVIILVWGLRISSEWTMRIFFNVYLDTVLGASTALIGVLLAGGQLLGLAALLSPAAMKRFGKRRTIVWATIGMAAAFVPLLMVAHWSAVGVGFILMTALVSISGPAFNVMSQELVLPQWRTTVGSAVTFSLGLGIALAALAGGFIIVRAGYEVLFAIGALLALTSALIFQLYFRKPRGQVATEMEAPAVTPLPVQAAVGGQAAE